LKLIALLEGLLEGYPHYNYQELFHYEFAFIHPFADGNGRMGRLWQTLILSQWQDIFSYLPVESLIYAPNINSSLLISPLMIEINCFT
jgi:fido (protein-threonine AMPylation protein)